MNTTQQLTYVDRPEGRIAVEVSGRPDGPLVVLVPGMGDLRSTFRYLVPALTGAGYRVAATDLRGHGDSDVTFTEYGDVETAADVVAVIEKLGGAPAAVIGNSMGSAAAVIVAADRPELVSGIVMLGPVVRDHPMSFGMRVMARVLLAPPWVATSWKVMLPMFYKGRKPADHEAHLNEIKASLKRPGRGAAFSKLARVLTHEPAEARLGAVRTPSLVLIGEADPDAPVPAEEAAWIAEQIKGEAVVIEECGHYPQSQRPDVVNPAVVAFLDRVAGA